MTNVKMNGCVPNIFGLVDRILQDEVNLNVHQKPPVNIVETNESFDLHIIAPGLQKDDFVLEVKENFLTISYTKPDAEKEADVKFIKKEFTISSFKRTFTLTDKLDSEKIEANYTDGILKVSISKKEVVEIVSKTIKVS
jgi:HSP20 family protein